MAEYIEKATLLNRVIIPSICSCVQGPTAERLKKFCVDTVNSVSAADVAPVVHGHWISWEQMFPDKTPRRKNNLGVFCSKCKLYNDNCTDYCPNCGAKMDEKEKDDD